MDVISIGESMIAFSTSSYGRMRYKNEFTNSVAGAETNTLIGLSRLGYDVGWISRLGNDEFGTKILNFVRGEGVDTSQVIIDETNQTGIMFKEMISEHNVKINYYRKQSAASFLSPSDLNESYFTNVKYLHITGITPALSQSSANTIFKAIELAKKHNVTIVFDPNIRKKLWSDEECRKAFLKIIANTDVVLPGLNEGQLITQKQEPKDIAKYLHDLGAKIVVIKEGEKGAYYSTLNSEGFIESYKNIKVVDPIGAGDGFAAGLISGLIDGCSIGASVKRACAIGAMVVTAHGDVENLPSKKELLDFVNDCNSEDDVIR